MFDSLNQLKDKLCTVKNNVDVSEEEVEEFKKNCTVVLMAGGEGSRFGKYSELEGKHKTVLRTDRETLIERIIRIYASSGITDFVALVYHHADSIKEILGDGSKFQVNIRYSHDPGKPVGKGGAMLNAIQKGVIKKGANVIVHNPDDQIVDIDKFADKIIVDHLSGRKNGRLCTVVVVEGTDYAYTGMKIKNSSVEQIKMYPFIPIPTHIGVTIFDSNALDSFEQHFDLEHKEDFESKLFPIFADAGQLYSSVIPKGTWFSINNPKELKKFLEAMKTS